MQVALIEAGPDHRSAEAPEAMRSPNPSRIINAPDYEMFRWDTLQARRTTRKQPRLYWRGRGLGGSSDDQRPDRDSRRTRRLRSLGRGRVHRLGICRRAAVLQAPRDRPALRRRRLSRQRRTDPDLSRAACRIGDRSICARAKQPSISAIPGRRITTHRARSAFRRTRSTAASIDASTRTTRTSSRTAVATISPSCAIRYVDKVLFDGDRAIGVRCVTNGRWHDVYANEVILSAGAIHSPPILMRSGIGPADHLRDLDIEVRVPLPVGDSFQDHPIAAFPIVLKDAAIPPPDFRHTNCCVRYSSELGGAGPGDMMLVAMNRLGDGLGRHTRAPTPNFGLIGVWVNECFSRGTIRLASADPLAHPIIEENMLDDRERPAAHARRHQAAARTRAPAGVRRDRRIHRHRRIDRRHRYTRQRCRDRRVGADRVSVTRNTARAVAAWASADDPLDRRGSTMSRARCSRTARHRCVDHAERTVREHAPDHGDDRRAHGRPTQERLTWPIRCRINCARSDSINDKKLKKAQRVKHAAEMERKAHGASADDPAVAAQRARAEKAARDRALNEERDRQANQKALTAQIRQLIELNRQPRDDGEHRLQLQGRSRRQETVGDQTPPGPPGERTTRDREARRQIRTRADGRRAEDPASAIQHTVIVCNEARRTGPTGSRRSVCGLQDSGRSGLVAATSSSSAATPAVRCPGCAGSRRSCP